MLLADWPDALEIVLNKLLVRMFILLSYQPTITLCYKINSIYFYLLLLNTPKLLLNMLSTTIYLYQINMFLSSIILSFIS